MVSPIKVSDVRATRGLNKIDQSILGTLIDYINKVLVKPENWNNLFAIDTSERPNPNVGVRIAIAELSTIASGDVTEKIIQAVVDSFVDPEVGWEVQYASGNNPPILIFKP